MKRISFLGLPYLDDCACQEAALTFLFPHVLSVWTTYDILNELHRNRKSPAAQILDLLTELIFWIVLIKSFSASGILRFYDLQKTWTSCPWQASRCWCWGCRRRRTGFNLTSWLCAITKLKRQTLACWQGPAQLQDFAHKQEKQQMSHSNSIYSDKQHVCNVLMVNLCSYKT